MVDRVSPMLAALACCGLLAAGGCTRTSDGSIEFQSNYGMPELPSLFKRKTASGPVVIAPTAFPAPPPSPVEIAAPRKPQPAARKTAQRPRKPAAAQPPAQVAPALPTEPIACRNVTAASGRVKYVCE